MRLSREEEEMFEGKHGNAVRKSMEILVALGEIYGADRLIPVSSVQIAGVSYDNLGDAGLNYLSELAEDGKVKVLTTLNPAGMDLEEWEKLGISEEFAKKQLKVVEAFKEMGVITTCTCTPYFIGNVPKYGDHIAWSESSAVAYANSVIGAKTNREGGPSALASALTGKTPNYGLHLDGNRQAGVCVDVNCEISGQEEFGALGYVVGNMTKGTIPLFRKIKEADVEELKSLGASIATYGGTAMYHIENITPNKTDVPNEMMEVSRKDIEEAVSEMNDDCDPDFISLGCPHASLKEVREIAQMLEGKNVKVETWVAVSRTVKETSDRMGYTQIIEGAGAKLASDTCMVVAPLKGRFKCLGTTSAKAVYYARGKQKFKVRLGSMEHCIKAAIDGKW